MNFKEDNFLSVYACCFPVKGACKSVIFDNQRRNYFEVPNSLLELMELFPTHSIASLYKEVPETQHEILDDYINFLLDNDIAFICEKADLENYPPMSMEWDAPHHIINSIIECEQYDKDRILNLIYQLEELLCPNIQLNFYSALTTVEIDEVMSYWNVSKIKSIEFLIPFHEKLNESDWETLFEKYSRLSRVIIYNSPENIYFIANKGNGSTVSFVKQSVDSTSCGQINKDYFTLSPFFFFESQQYNTCLNRKICVDKEGYIKNCPSMQKSFGNIANTSLEEALSHPDFKIYWNIHKDQIEVCKDCEYRHFCSDCRCFIADPNNMYSKPARCKYNPYKGEWE